MGNKQTNGLTIKPVSRANFLQEINNMADRGIRVCITIPLVKNSEWFDFSVPADLSIYIVNYLERSGFQRSFEIPKASRQFKTFVEKVTYVVFQIRIVHSELGRTQNTIFQMLRSLS